jgi:hypothetical protein
MSDLHEFNRLVGRNRLSEWKLEGADPAQAAFDALLAKHLAADVKMNKRDGYVPSKGVLAQREYSRQFDELEKLGKSVRADYWQERSGKNKVQVGFRDNRDKAEYQTAVAKLDDVFRAEGYTLFPRGMKMLSPKSTGTQHVVLKSNLADKVDAMRPEWLKQMSDAGADVSESKLAGEHDEAFVAAFAGHREAEGRPLSFDDWNATMRAALERNLGEVEDEGEGLAYNKFDLAKVSAALTPFKSLSFTPAREFGPVLFISGAPETLEVLAKMAEKRLGTYEAVMVTKNRLRLAWD